MICRRGFSSVSLLYWQSCRSIVLFESICIIRPAVFPAGLRLPVGPEHWHPVLFQVEDSAPSLGPSPEPDLVSNLATAAAPSLCFQSVSAGSSGPYQTVQTIAAAYRYLVCLYLRAWAVRANYSCPCPLVRGLYYSCQPSAHAALLCPGVHSPCHLGPNLCLANLGLILLGLYPAGFVCFD
jgi:hypothetical protein